MHPSAYSDLQLRIGVFLAGGLLCLLLTTALLVQATFAGDARTATETPDLGEEHPLEAGLPMATQPHEPRAAPRGMSGS